MNNTEEKQWHLDRYQKAALYWNNLANQRVFELNRQLLALATIILPLTASIIAIDFIKPREFEKTLLLIGWVFLFLSIILAFVQIWIDANYFSYLSQDSSTREELWSHDRENEKIKKDVDALGKVKGSSTFIPTIFQAFFVFTGLLFIMIVASSMLLRR